MPRVLILAALAALLPCIARAQGSSNGTWRFAVSGDSRNCGDVVMPAIAKSALENNVEFYWHLGDFRVGNAIDEDMANQYGKTLTAVDYPNEAWGDFVQHQVAAFGTLPVFLGIGNHELYKDGRGKEEQSHADYLAYFYSWLDTPVLRKQRLAEEAALS
jgi:hypothetical protein